MLYKSTIPAQDDIHVDHFKKIFFCLLLRYFYRMTGHYKTSITLAELVFFQILVNVLSY